MYGTSPKHYAWCIQGVSRPVDSKPTWRRSTFASCSTQARSPSLPRNTMLGKRWKSQRLSGKVTCQGRVTRIVRSRAWRIARLSFQLRAPGSANAAE
ncbi:hypothetical protein DICSQDRAFT_138718 [Dichomitus squalens LYAD-421 SS1]|uniref:Uncharacterized protein n=1 Tax=Dichomitus squalens (strain LYAD-421) TaxID=732165 RepID=R7SWD8_DICSQ|nr:uncharacterized protein DICSQDRAFT_138718 [Dichomitus squalens LYAD-421 SS1]EJF59282.1 hypothetical protein DICSQDRAFT_138718 [Dichomitus squalens LYAD-421 SS1]